MEKPNKKDKIKQFLTQRHEECTKKIKKYKCNKRIFNGIYSSLIIISVIGASIAFTLPGISMIIVGTMAQFSSISAALLIRLDIKNKNINRIQNLYKIKDKLEYIISCNEDLTEEECENILNEFRQI
jgi:hypothetical protein